MLANGMNPDQLISDLPYDVTLEISQYLDVGTNKMNWRALIASIPDQIYSDTDIESFALEIHKFDGSPSMKLLRDLGTRMRTVRQLISYLEKISQEKCLNLLKKPEPIRFLQMPLSQTLQTGMQAIISCTVKGFPSPCYRWYRAYALDPEVASDKKREVKLEEVEGAADRVLKINSVLMKHSGAYCCQVYHTMNGQLDQKFTDWAYLEVYPPSNDFQDCGEDLAHMQKPQIIQQPPVSLSVRPGKPIKVTCLATGCPSPKYQWYRYGYSSKESPLEPHALKGQADKTLYWAQSRTEDQGKYCCRVVNKAGFATSTTVIIAVDARMAETYPGEIEILRHPQSVACRIGDQQILACQAAIGQGTLFYQWLLNNKEIPGATQNELHFLQLTPEDRGIYQCRIYNQFACTMSKEAMLEVIGAEPIPQNPDYPQFSATDKVALLIGNQDYRSAGPLNAPEGDVEKLAVELSNLDFKVVSLLNLNLQEMHFALHAFCAMLNAGVYGLFYFSGHGFEMDGQSYLVPVDAAAGYSTGECLCDQQVLDYMQYRDTALNVVLLDICREKNSYPQEEPVFKYKPKVKGNSIFGYAAQTNTQAYEVEGQPSGIFTQHLIKHIKKPKRISHILEDVMRDVNNDPCAKGIQIPALSFDLYEARSLVDPINPEGHTQEISARSRMWGEAHLLPESPIWLEFQNGISVYIELATRFSNVLLMHSYIPPDGTGDAQTCHVRLERFSPELDIKMEKHEVCVRYDDCTPPSVIQMVKTTVRNLQRLRGDLQCVVTVMGAHQGKLFKESRPLVISKPLVSMLWQTRHFPVPSETTDPVSSTSTNE